MIEVTQIDDTTFEVRVEGQFTTKHTVTVDPAYHAALTGGSTPVDELVRRSFEFLLEREPNTSILSQFDLRVINDYFPEYEQEIRASLK